MSFLRSKNPLSQLPNRKNGHICYEKANFKGLSLVNKTIKQMLIRITNKKIENSLWGVNKNDTPNLIKLTIVIM